MLNVGKHYWYLYINSNLLKNVMQKHKWIEISLKNPLDIFAFAVQLILILAY